MRTLELFAGTQSFTKAVLRKDPSAVAVTLDLLPKFNPTIQKNILEWDYREYKPGHFDIIWCSPPCTEYSKAKTRGVRDLSGADQLVLRCFEILDYFQPRVWFVENVGTGLLVRRMESLRRGLSMYFVDYCAYGKPYKKTTVIWSNIHLDLQRCTGPGSCPSMEGKKHLGSCGNGSKRYNKAGIHSVWEKDAIPDRLMDHIVQTATGPT